MTVCVISLYAILLPRHNDKTIEQWSEIHFNVVLVLYRLVVPDQQRTITTKMVLKGESEIHNSRSVALNYHSVTVPYNDRMVFKVYIVPSLWRLPVYMCNKK